MRRSDLEDAAQLFELVGGGANKDEDSEAWDNKFQDHVTRVMTGHSAALQNLSTQLEKGLESFRARAQLLEVVQERLIARVVQTDPELAEAVHQLHAAWEMVFQEALQLQARQELRQRQGEAESPVRRSRSNSPSTAALSGGGGSLESPRPPKPAAQAPRGERYGWQCIMDDEGTGSPGSVATTSKLATSSSSRGNKGYAQIHDARYQRERYERFVGKPGKEMSLQQLKDHIENLYSSKDEANERLKAAALPYQTLEQHFYSCLVRRFGQLSVVEEWARTFFMAIEKFAENHVEIQAFGKILQNRLSEHQAVVLKTLKETAKKLLHQQLEERNPNTSQADLDGLWVDWQKNGLPLAVCESVVSHMYEARDADELMEQVRPLAGPPGASLPDIARVCGREFRETLLAFQMKLAEFYTSDLQYMYFEIDRDALEPCKGVLTSCQALELARRMAHVDEPEEIALAGSRFALEDELSGTMSRLADKKAVSLSECIDDIFVNMISVRWKARGGIDRYKVDKQE